MNKFRHILVLAAYGAILSYTMLFADPNTIKWEVVASGGTNSYFANGSHLSGSAMQTAVGVVTSQNYVVNQGFWNKNLVCKRGDANGNGTATISDAVYIINYVFANGPAPTTVCGGDPDGNGYTNVSDAIWLIRMIFKS